MANKELAQKDRRSNAQGHRRVMNANQGSYHDDLLQIKKCTSNWPCRRSACPHCGGGVPRSTRQEPSIIQTSKTNLPAHRIKRRATGDSFIERKGLWMEQPFVALPWDEVSVLRIMVKMMDADENPVHPWTRFRRDLRSILKGQFPDAIVRGYAEIAGNHAHAGFRSFPEHRVGSKIRASGFANMPSFNLHGNLIMNHPGRERTEVEAILSDAFPGEDALWVSEAKDTWIDQDGFEWGGLTGWGEYSGFELKPLNFLARRKVSDLDQDYDPYAPHEYDNTYVAHTRMLMLQKLTRPMRNFKFRDDEDSIVENVRRAWLVEHDAIKRLPDGEMLKAMTDSPVDATSVAPEEGSPTRTNTDDAERRMEPCNVLHATTSDVEARLEVRDLSPAIHSFRDTNTSTLVLDRDSQSKSCSRTKAAAFDVSMTWDTPLRAVDCFLGRGLHTIKSEWESCPKSSMKTIPLESQIPGFCMRPGIDKPP